VATKGAGKVDDGPEPRACVLTLVLVCVGIAVFPYIVAVVGLIHVLLSETDNNEKGIEKVFSSFQIIKIIITESPKMPYMYFFLKGPRYSISPRAS
jgi:chemotaxis receptor (MCP) glutamine deamidase CheD